MLIISLLAPLVHHFRAELTLTRDSPSNVWFNILKILNCDNFPYNVLLFCLHYFFLFSYLLTWEYLEWTIQGFPGNHPEWGLMARQSLSYLSTQRQKAKGWGMESRSLFFPICISEKMLKNGTEAPTSSLSDLHLNLTCVQQKEIMGCSPVHSYEHGLRDGFCALSCNRGVTWSKSPNLSGISFLIYKMEMRVAPGWFSQVNV